MLAFGNWLVVNALLFYGESTTLRAVGFLELDGRLCVVLTLREFVRSLAPPLIVDGYRQLTKKKKFYYLSGDYQSWDEAVAASTGYDAELILEKTKQALLQVKNGQAVYERDSVLFDEVQYSWPLLAGLMWVAAQSGGDLNVLDFGGSLGSTYFQNRTFLRGLSWVRWNIVEQPRHVEIGRQWFEDNTLRFYRNIEECLAETKPNVVILSSILQYLETPYYFLRKLMELPCNDFLIDRTPFWDGPTDRLCVQHVQPDVYPASYPSWILARGRFLEVVSRNLDLVVEFPNSDSLEGPVDFGYRGMIMTRRFTQQ